MKETMPPAEVNDPEPEVIPPATPGKLRVGDIVMIGTRKWRVHKTTKKGIELRPEHGGILPRG